MLFSGKDRDFTPNTDLKELKKLRIKGVKEGKGIKH